MSGAAKRAVSLYETFHRLEPSKVGEFSGGFAIPKRVERLGVAVDVVYRSGKVDPSTLLKPTSLLDYVHDFEAGVQVYKPARHMGTATTPRFVREAKELVLLGQCLEFSYQTDDGDVIEGKAGRPYPELYAAPNGKALLIVQDKRKIEVLIWGGKLGVEDRGIVH